MSAFMPEPTPRQLEVLRLIDQFQREKGYAPTVRELMKRLGITENATADNLKAMRRKDLVRWEPGKARTLAITLPGRQALQERAA